MKYKADIKNKRELLHTVYGNSKNEIKEKLKLYFQEQGRLSYIPLVDNNWLIEEIPQPQGGENA